MVAIAKQVQSKMIAKRLAKSAIESAIADVWPKKVQLPIYDIL